MDLGLLNRAPLVLMTAYVAGGAALALYMAPAAPRPHAPSPALGRGSYEAQTPVFERPAPAPAPAPKPPVDGRGSGDRREAAEHENWSIDVPVTPQRPTRLVMPVPAGGGTMNLQIETGDAVYAHFANGTRPVVFVDTFEVWPRELSAGFGQSKSCCAGRRG